MREQTKENGAPSDRNGSKRPAASSRRIAAAAACPLWLFAHCLSLAAPPPARAQTPAPQGTRLNLDDAEQLALKNNPQISVAKLLSLAQNQVTREVRSAELPNAVANLTAVEPNNPGSRVAAGALNNPSLYERAAGGVTLGQLITDFGRTRNLVASAGLRAQAQAAAEQATEADIRLAVDQAFYTALGAQAQLNVAQQTVNARQTTADQVQALFNSKLKSQLDLSFANVNLAQAKLLLLDAQNRQAASFADLNAILGYDRQQVWTLLDPGGPLPAPAPNADDLLQMAFRSRPDLAAINDQSEAAERFRRAEHDLYRPTVSALGVVGDAPVRVPQIQPWWGAVGVNVQIPVFNGFLFNARASEADYRAAAAKQQVRDLRDRIARDVQVSWLQAQTAYQRVSVAQQLLNQANLALDLAQTRYNLGLSSIVELSQAQLQQTEAAIGNANARYSYLAATSVLRYQTGQ